MKLTEMDSKSVAKLFAKVDKLNADGATYKQIMEATGLNHSQVELHLIAARLTDEDYNAFAAGGDTLQAQVVAARKSNRPGWSSWGVLSVLAGEPESKVRKLWADSTGLKSAGLRIGRGGRWYYRDGELYAEVLKPTGTEIPVGTNHEGARVEAQRQRLFKLEWDSLKRVGERYGVQFKKGQTKVTFARAIWKAAQNGGATSEAEVEAQAS